MGHPYKFQWVLRLGMQRYCTASSSGHQPNFAALNRQRHLCTAGRPSRWTLAHILVTIKSNRQKPGVVRTGEEENDDDRVDDREPMNLNVTHCKVGVPPRRPPHLTTVPLYPVREHQVHGACNMFGPTRITMHIFSRKKTKLVLLLLLLGCIAVLRRCSLLLQME